MTDIVTSTGGDLIDHHDEQVRRITAGWLIGQRSSHTRQVYQRGIRTWIAWCRERGIDPVNPQRQEVQAWITHMREIAGHSPATVRVYHAAVKGWHTELSVEGARQPLDVHYRLRLPTKTETADTRLLSDLEVRGLIIASRTLPSPAETAVCMMATMGMRATEVGRAHAGMVEPSPYGPLLRSTGKGGKVTIRPVPKLVQQAARRVRWPGWDLVEVPGRDNWSDERVYQRVRRWTDRVGELAQVPDFHPHMLRHWWISRALQLGVEERHVQAGAGHASFDTTARYNRANDDLEHHPTHTIVTLFDGL